VERQRTRRVQPTSGIAKRLAPPDRRVERLRTRRVQLTSLAVQKLAKPVARVERPPTSAVHIVAQTMILPANSGYDGSDKNEQEWFW
jgi:hypothetical protein